MMYFVPAATLAMLGYIFWLAVFRMRRDRVETERQLTRGKYAFRPRERVRFLLNRAFHPRQDKAEWEDPLVSRLSQIPAPNRQDRHRS